MIFSEDLIKLLLLLKSSVLIFFPVYTHIICKLDNSNLHFNNLNYKAWQISFCQKVPILITVKTNHLCYCQQKDYRHNHSMVPTAMFAMPLKIMCYYRIQGIRLLK